MKSNTRTETQVNTGDPIAHVIVQYGNRGVLCLTADEYDAHVARNRLLTAPPEPRIGGVIARAMGGVRS